MKSTVAIFDIVTVSDRLLVLIVDYGNFCVRNELLTIENFWEWKFIFDGVTFNYYKSSPKFRLLESTLIPEEELAKFLVDNIIVEWLGKN